MIGSFDATDENGKKVWLFYTGKDFKDLKPGEVYKDRDFNPYTITSFICHHMPTDIKVMEQLKYLKKNRVIWLDGPCTVAAVEELLLPLGFKIVFAEV